MKTKTTKTMRYVLMTAVASMTGMALLFGGSSAVAHKDPHDAATLKAFNDAFMEQVVMGDRLYHGDGAAEKQMNVTLSKTGMACAMCHPFGSDTHPHEFPKFQEQMSEFATLRDMINWCIEKPNEGVKIDPNSPAMKALEAYIYWSNKDSKLDAGRH
jgi:thiosulfate dehydrogenase